MLGLIRGISEKKVLFEPGQAVEKSGIVLETPEPKDGNNANPANPRMLLSAW